MRRRIALVLCCFLCLGGGALAATVTGTDGPDRLRGTARADAISGQGGADRISGGAGGDLLDGGPGRDAIAGGTGNDRIAAAGDGAADTVACGPGRDLVNADAKDRVAGDCEVVSRRLSRDPYTSPESQHETQVEPDSFAYGTTIVTAFQSGRFVRGGASGIGFATSLDAGGSWRSGVLPELSASSTSAGPAERVSDPVVAFDAVHGTWLIASLGVSGADTSIFVSRSRDGVRWERPVRAAVASTGELAYDKEWLACDNWQSSPLRGRCYLSYTDLAGERLATQSSSDGGATWSAAVTGFSGPLTGAQPVARPNGDLVVVFLARDELLSVRSGDGGGSFDPPARVAVLQAVDVRGLRDPPLPSIDAAADGTVLAAWHDCRFRAGCRANDIVVSSSADGVAWTRPRRLPLSPVGGRRGHFVPGLTVDPGSSRVAVAYHSLVDASCPEDSCLADVALVESLDGGKTWGRPERLSAQSMPLTWLADTSLGRMLGDYISTSYVGGRAVPVFSLASRPVGDALRQAISATTRRRR
ncbi:MAG: exo-alpha-sialidase [Actinobacteria bacterium]|nr:exo-alpha-sialidase [Actinomycetota bacterium]